MSSEVASASVSSTPSKHDRDVTVEAVNHLIQGKRHLLVQDIPSAVNSLEEACRLLDSCYGSLANECGEAYYYYGVALLELSRRETGILTDAVDGSGSEQEEEEDDDEDEEDEEDADGESGDDSKTTEKVEVEIDQMTSTSKDGETSENTDSKGTGEKSKNENRWHLKACLQDGDSEAKSEDLADSEKADEGKSEEKKEEPSTSDCVKESVVTKDKPNVDSVTPPVAAATSASSAADATPGTSDDKASGTDTSVGEDEPSTLQLAWESFEVAKIIFKRQSENNDEMQLKLAQVHLKLGEVAMESDNYQQSIDDLNYCIKAQHFLLSSDDRRLAETYYQLGLALSFASQFDSSIGSFKSAIKVLEEKIVNLEKQLLEKGVETNEGEGYLNPHETTRKEIEEIKELIPEIQEKISDTEDLQKNSVRLRTEMNGEGSSSKLCKASEELVDSTTSPSQTAAKPTTNIDHLVRKKRRTDDSEVSTSNSNEGEGKLKRPRADVADGQGSDVVSESGDALVSNGSCNVNGMDTETAGDNSKSVDNSVDSTAKSI